MDQSVLFFQAFAELCEIKFGKTHPVCNLVSLFFDTQPFGVKHYFLLMCWMLYVVSLAYRWLPSLCGVLNLWALAVAERSRDSPIWEPSSTSLCLQRMMCVVQSRYIGHSMPEIKQHLNKSRTFQFSPDQSGRQVFLWPSHHHGEHAGRQPVIAALSGVCEGGRLLH